MRCTGYEMARYKGAQASHLYEKPIHTLCTIIEQPLLAEASSRYRSQYRPNTCVGVAFTKAKPALATHDQVHMYLYNIYRPIYRPYLHNYNTYTG